MRVSSFQREVGNCIPETIGGLAQETRETVVLFRYLAEFFDGREDIARLIPEEKYCGRRHDVALTFRLGSDIGRKRSVLCGV